MMDRTGSPAVQVNGLSSFFPPAECAFFAEHQRAAFLNAKAERFPHCLEVSEALYQKLQLVPTIVKMVRDATEINRDPEVLAARCPYPMENIRTFIESVFAKIDRGEDPNIRMFGYGSLTGLDREKTIGSVAAIPLLLSGWKRYLHSKVASNCTQAHRRVGLHEGPEIGSAFLQYTADSNQVIGVGLHVDAEDIAKLREREHFYSLLPVQATDPSGQVYDALTCVPISKRMMLRQMPKTRIEELKPLELENREPLLDGIPDDSNMRISRVYLDICLDGVDHAGMRDEFLDSSFCHDGMTLRQYLKLHLRDNIKTGKASQLQPGRDHLPREQQLIYTGTSAFGFAGSFG